MRGVVGRRSDAARRGGGGDKHVAGGEGARGGHRRLGRERRGEETRSGSSDAIMASYRTLAAQPGKAVAPECRQCRARPGGRGEGAGGDLRVSLPRPCCPRAAATPSPASRTVASRSGAGTRCPTLPGDRGAGRGRRDAGQGDAPCDEDGGGFGRRAVADGDIIVEAVAVSNAIGGRPVRVQWTREDDMRGGRYRPAYVHR